MMGKVTTRPSVQERSWTSRDVLCGEHAHYVERTGDPLCQQLKICACGNKKYPLYEIFEYT
jgi:hypothetical protein